MKGLVFGCLGVTVLIIVGGAIGAYFFVWKPASNFIGGVTQFAQLSELDERVQNRSRYEAPASGELTKDQVTRFIVVQRELRERLGKELETLDAKYQRMQAKLDARNAEAGFQEVMVGLRDMAETIVLAKELQVEALNRHDFSLDEYQWVHGQVYAAADLFMPEISFRELYKQAEQTGTVPEFKKSTVDDTILDHNRELVQEHRQFLEEMVVLAWFGL